MAPKSARLLRVLLQCCMWCQGLKGQNLHLNKSVLRWDDEIREGN